MRAVLWLLLSEYTKRHAQVHLLLEEPWALLGESVQGQLLVRCRGFIPLVQLLVRCRGFIPLVWFRARLEWKNTLSLERGSLSVSGCCPAGETSRLPVLLPGKNCGILEISLKSFSTWDPLGLFCRKKRPLPRPFLVIATQNPFGAAGIPRPFLVIATQNPFGAAGTQPLPTAQADRFSLSLSMGYPAFEDEVRLAHEAEKGRRRDQTEPISDCESFSRMCREASGVYIHDSLCRYIVSLVDATRNQELFELGASPRSTLSLVKLSKTLAWLQGENYVTPSQIKELFPDVVKHRVVISHKARRQGISRDALLEDILRKTAVPLDSLKGPVNHLKHLF